MKRSCVISVSRPSTIITQPSVYYKDIHSFATIMCFHPIPPSATSCLAAVPFSNWTEVSALLDCRIIATNGVISTPWLPSVGTCGWAAYNAYTQTPPCRHQCGAMCSPICANYRTNKHTRWNRIHWLRRVELAVHPSLSANPMLAWAELGICTFILRTFTGL